MTASRALALNSQAGPPLPKVPMLEPLYEAGITPRRNELIMVVGRPGHQKSGFALAWVEAMGLPTLYFSGDMSPFQASIRLACMRTGHTVEQMEVSLRNNLTDIDKVLGDLPVQFAFGKPIRWDDINAELEAYVEVWDAFPEVIVFDNLMDFEAGETDYAAQMAVLQELDAMKADTGSTIIVLHHATDKGPRAVSNPELPPPRSEIKGGMGEKPELVLGVALNPLNLTFNIAPLKQRMGKSDQSGNTFVTLQTDPERTQFRPLQLDPRKNI